MIHNRKIPACLLSITLSPVLPKNTLPLIINSVIFKNIKNQQKCKYYLNTFNITRKQEENEQIRQQELLHELLVK